MHRPELVVLYLLSMSLSCPSEAPLDPSESKSWTTFGEARALYQTLVELKENPTESCRDTTVYQKWKKQREDGLLLCINRVKYRMYEFKSKCEHGRRLCNKCHKPLHIVIMQGKFLRRLLKNPTMGLPSYFLEYLGCSFSFFKELIQKKMIPGMEWSNINLDHIKPINAFKLDNRVEFLDCCHYTNIQPLFARDNRRKSSKWNNVDEMFWNEHIRRTEYLPLYFPHQML